ncbi:hypothetical protein EYR38_006710 [Pleurotus pulmonarius]|nr:hypothetical protein EYR38_006710 [Pleurotus pulmonarius]
MSLSFGGLALLSSRTSVSDLVTVSLGRDHIKSIFCLLIFVIVVVLLAYLTNPSETSFRAYLTEQSFRLHLSHLDDHLDDKADAQTQPVNGVRPGPQGSAAYRPPVGDHLAASFHFAKRASVSLRTPKHVFHNFGICTIAAMMPIGKTPGRICNTTSYHLRDRDASSLIADSWYIGAFGRWWRGGVIEAWYRDLIARSSDEESWSSGILGIKSLDKFHNDCNGLPFTTKPRESTPKVRGRDRHQSSHQSRSQSPPPLPQSVSLPLHTTHQDLAPLVIPSTTESSITGSHPRPVSDGAPPDVDSAVPLSRTSSTLFDQSPLIAEVLRQISAVKTSVQDARTQLMEQQASAAQSHASLQSEVTILRDRKRDEDATRLDLKSRTRALEESKRVSESSRRDAERRLKAARSARDDVSRRVESLSKEIQALQTQRDEDVSDIEARKEAQGITAMEIEISEAISGKRKEIKVAEDVVATLALRAKGLEEKLANERERLKALRDRVEHDRQIMAPTTSHLTSQELWTISQQPGFVPSPISEYPTEIFDAGLPSPISDDAAHHFSSNIQYTPEHLPNYHGYDVSLSQSDLYPTLTDYKPLLTTEYHSTTNFSPFNNDSDNGQDHAISSLFNHRPLVAPNYSNTLDSTQHDASPFPSDLSFDGRWRRNMSSGVHELSDTQAIGMHHLQHSLGTSEINLVEDAGSNRDVLRGQSAIRRVVPHRTYSDPPHVHNPDQSWEAVTAAGHDGSKGSFPRRWFSTSLKGPKKGLNPDAKVFNLPSFVKGSNPILGASLGLQSYDNLNPNGLSMSSLSSTATSGTLFSGAFAPSPAEREVLQRALGSSSNASLERLPSLSDVGSIPSSPNHAHATVANMNNAPTIGLGLHPPHNGIQQSHHMFPLPSWLQSLPRVRKPNFSPWDDEEPAASASEAGRGDLIKSM